MKFSVSFLAAFIILGTGFFIVATHQTSIKPQTAKTSLHTIKIGKAVVYAEVADTFSKRAQGLSGRESLPADQGMLFVFPTAGRAAFWMKDMNFPLDFVFIKKNKVVAIYKNAPIGKSPPFTLRPAVDYQAALEVNAGWIAAHGVKIGMSASY